MMVFEHDIDRAMFLILNHLLPTASQTFYFFLCLFINKEVLYDEMSKLGEGKGSSLGAGYPEGSTI